ncbi:MAG: hypothetical protein KC729_18185, partial [Candidatus Eisenbacteria bacterium]|nr:hypothetical protein [Candidatus Eisenbacteria bacterium]
MTGPRRRATGPGDAQIRKDRPWAAAISMILAAWSVPALAAPNEHGQLFFHARPDLVYSSAGNPAGQSDLSDCRDAETTVPLGEESIVWYVL